MTGRSELCGFGTTFSAKRWLSLDACGLLCLSLSFSVHVYALIVTGMLLISQSLFAQIVYMVVYTPATLLALCSLYMAWTTDPGAVPMGAKPLTTFKRQGSNTETTKQRGIRRCHKCMDNYKPPRAHHDSVTGRCVVKMDHYCPWVCNAVGALNHKFFCLFIGYTFVSSFLAFLLIVTRFVHCSYVEASSDSDDENDNMRSKSSEEEEEDQSVRLLLQDGQDECEAFHNGNFLVLVLLMLSVVFLIFTCCMLIEQMDAISSNTWKIARMKVKVGKAGTELKRVTHDFNEMFGGDSPHVAWHWFLPLSVKFPKGMRSVVLGYDFDETADDTVPFDEEKDVCQDSQSLSAGISVQDEEDEQDDEEEESDDQSGPLVASPGDAAHLGPEKPTNNKRGMFKRRDTSPKFVDRTTDLA